MGIPSWFKGNSNKPTSSSTTTEKPNPNLKPIVSTSKPTDEIPDTNGAVEVFRPASNVDVTVFEFGSVVASTDKVTLAGYCPVSDDVELCRWEILSATGSDAPQFRVVF